MANENTPPDLEQLQKLGLAGKLWTLAIIFTWDGETRRLLHRNLTNAQQRDLRSEIFEYGFLHPVTKDSWRVVCPLDIDKVFLDKQSNYFPG